MECAGHGCPNQAADYPILIREVVLDRDDVTNEALVTIRWNGGRHTELRVSRVRTGRYPADRHPSPVEAIRKLGGQLPDRELAVTMNRMRCKPADGNAWTTVRVRELRERPGNATVDRSLPRIETNTGRHPKFYKYFQEDKTLRLPSL
jgi:hypothetical protein